MQAKQSKFYQDDPNGRILIKVTKAIQKATWGPAAISIANRPQRCPEAMRNHRCETIAGKTFTSLALELLECSSTGTVMISVRLILEGILEGNERGLIAAGGKIDTQAWPE